MSSEPPGFELPLRLLLGFRMIIDRLHAELAQQGHADMRPLHGFVFQAVGRDGITGVELARRLGVTKQAAAKTIEQLERLGYLDRTTDPADARRRTVRLTERGVDALRRSARILDQLRREWVEEIGPDRLRALEEDLRRLTPDDLFRLDAPGWLSS